MSNINDRYDSLKKIYKVLGDTQILDEGEIVNYDEIIKNLYYLNLLVFKTYKIFSANISRKEMIDRMCMLKDPEGQLLLTRDVAESILDLYKEPLVAFYRELENKSIIKQKGGYEREEYFSNNKVYDYIYDYLKKFGIEKDASLLDVVNLIKNMNPVSIQLLFRGMPIEQAKLLKKLSSEEFLDVVEKYYPLRLIYNMGKYANVLSITELEKRTKRYDNWIEENQELVDFAKAGLLIGPKAAYKVGKYIFDWIFFPLYSLENLPLVGIAFEIPFDIIGTIIDNSGIIFEPLSHVIPKGLDILLGVGSGVPLPGLNTAIAAVGLGMKFAEKPLQYMIAHGPDVFGLFLNVQRKQWGLAYASLLEVIPGFASLMDATVTNLYTMNKYAYKGVRFTDFFKNTIITTRSLSKPFLQEPQIMFQPKGVWDKVVYPNRQRLPIIRNIPIDTINKHMILLKSMYNKGSNFVIDKKNRLLELGKFNSKSVMQEFLEAKKIESMDVINKALKKKDKLEKRVAEAKDKAKSIEKNVRDKVNDKTDIKDKVKDAKKEVKNKVKKTVNEITKAKKSVNAIKSMKKK